MIGGSKAAGLRSGASSGAASKPTKTQRDSTRAERIEAGKAQAAYGVYAQASKRKANPYVKELADRGYSQNAQSSASARAAGFQSTKEAAKLIQGQQTIPRARRIAKGRKVLEQFRASQEAKNQAAYGGGLFAPKAPTPKPKPDYSSTRAQRVAAGKAKAMNALSGTSMGSNARRALLQRGDRNAAKRDGMKEGFQALEKRRNGSVGSVVRSILNKPVGERRAYTQGVLVQARKATRAQRIQRALSTAGSKLYAPTFTGGKPGKTTALADLQRKAYAALKRKQKAAEAKYGSR